VVFGVIKAGGNSGGNRCCLPKELLKPIANLIESLVLVHRGGFLIIALYQFPCKIISVLGYFNLVFKNR
jgi:hypothetical protein